MTKYLKIKSRSLLCVEELGSKSKYKVKLHSDFSGPVFIRSDKQATNDFHI